MHLDFIIDQGTIFLENEEAQVLDIGIKNSRVAVIGNLSQSSAEERFSAKGLTIIPGIIDSHVHMREPGMEYKGNLHSETRRALMGGVTAIMEMPNTFPHTTSEITIEDKCARARSRAWVDYAFYLGASSSNFEKLPQLEKTFGCCGIKIFMCASTGDLSLDADDEIYSFVMRNTKRLIAVHAENGNLIEEAPNYLKTSHVFHPQVRSKESCISSVKRIVALARANKRKIHVLHVSSTGEIEEIRRSQGYVTGEITPHHLLLGDSYQKYGALAQVNPPIRERVGQFPQAFTTIGSDHAPHTIGEKVRPYPLSPSGMPGVQTMCPLILNCVNQGMLTMRDFVDLLCINPARIFSLENRGHIRPGAEATFTILDMGKKETISEKWLGDHGPLSPFLGWKVTGWPFGVIMRGNWAMREGEVIGSPIGEPLRFIQG